jgi:hypothetical protein
VLIFPGEYAGNQPLTPNFHFADRAKLLLSPNISPSAPAAASISYWVQAPPAAFKKIPRSRYAAIRGNIRQYADEGPFPCRVLPPNSSPIAA